MAGVLVYLYFLAIGFGYSQKLFYHKDIYFKSWMGMVFGNIILMAGIVPFAFLFGFTYISHVVLMIAAAIPYVIMSRKSKDGLTAVLPEKSGIDLKIFLLLIVPITLVICIIMTNHILTPVENSAVASGQSTYGDLQMHLGFVTSIAEQEKFPPDYAFLSGYKLNYPFFVDMLSSSLFLFGMPLRWAVLFPSYVLSLALVMGFYILAYKITKRKAAAVLATALFFFNGGFGFAYFIDGAKADINNFTRIFTGYYTTPTNYNDMNIRWSNTICDMIVPQRTTMAGWCVIIPCIYMLFDALKTKSKKSYVILALMAGTMPMIHTHSFLALGIISAVMFFAYLIKEEDKKRYISDWIIYGAIVLVMAMPQLFYWTFSQTSGNSSFLNLHFNWVNHNDTYFWFYIKNWGLIFLLAVPAFFNADKDTKKLLIGGLAIFVIAEIIQFQPNEYDNNKLFYITYMLAVMIVSGYMVNVYDKLKGIQLRGYLAAIIIIASTLSGVLTIIREYISGGEYQTYTADDMKMAQYIKENIPSESIILTGTQHINPVVSLAGRNVYVGSSLYVYFHGFTEEYQKRSSELERVYSGSEEDIKSFCRDKNISYVYLSEYEINEYNIDSEVFSKLHCVYKTDTNALFKTEN